MFLVPYITRISHGGLKLICANPILKKTSILVAPLLLSLGLCSNAASAQSSSEANSYAAFVVALTAISSSAGEVLEHEREQARLTMIRKAFTESMIKALPAPGSADTPAATLVFQLNEAELLCDVRYKAIPIVKDFSNREKGDSISINHLEMVANKAYIDTVINQLKEKSVRANNDNLFKALRDALTPASISAPSAILKDSDRDKLATYIETRCRQDLSEYEIAHYGQKIPISKTENIKLFKLELDDKFISQLPLFGPAGSLVSTVYNIIKPAALQFSNIAIDYKNNQAIRAFLENPNNKRNLIKSGEALAQKESDYLFAKRLSLAGDFAENLAAINQTPLDLTSKRVQAACGDVRSLYTRKDGEQPTAAFRKCHYVLWKQYEPAITAALAAASAYDRIADAGDTATQLHAYQRLTSNFKAIVQDSASAANWTDVTRMLTFANALKNVFSKESAQQVQAAIDAVKND